MEHNCISTGEENRRRVVTRCTDDKNEPIRGGDFFICSTESGPFSEPISVEIPATDTVRTLSSVLPRMKSHSGLKRKAPAIHAKAIMPSLTVKDREKTPLISNKSDQAKLSRSSQVRSFGDRPKLCKKKRRISFLVRDYLMVIDVLNVTALKRYAFTEGRPLFV